MNLQTRQQYDLDIKVRITENRIKSFYSKFEGQVYISFSGGKDSTVLLHIAKKLFPDIKVVFVNTGLEYPEIVDFVKTFKDIEEIKPKLNFKEVILNYGFPVVSKEIAQKINEIKNTNSSKLRNKRLYGDEKGNGKVSEKWKFLIKSPFRISAICCNKLKKSPVKSFEKKTGLHPITGTMATESALRSEQYRKKGCNSFEGNRPISNPLSIWTEQDIWNYIKKYNVSYSKIYDMGYERTGCMFCMFGLHMEKGLNRFDRMKITHPKQYQYCMNKLGLRKVIDYIDFMS